MTISAGTRTRNLWIRSPARSSIAPQRPHHIHSISTRTEKAHTFCITEPSQHPALSAVWGQGQLENLEWRSPSRLPQSFSQHCRVLGSWEDWKNVRMATFPAPESQAEEDRARARAVLFSPSLREDREKAFIYSHANYAEHALPSSYLYLHPSLSLSFRPSAAILRPRGWAKRGDSGKPWIPETKELLL